jgi:hypothetical protein
MYRLLTTTLLAVLLTASTSYALLPTEIALDADGDAGMAKIADLDGDGVNDYLVVAGDSIQAFVGGEVVGTSIEHAPIVLLDFSGDGILDVIVGAGGQCGRLQFQALVGDGEGGFDHAACHALPEPIQSDQYTTGGIVLDLNDDDVLDVAFTRTGNYGGQSYVAVLLGGSGAILRSDTGFGAFGLADIDVDFDKVPDLAVTQVDATAILRGNGDGTFKRDGAVVWAGGIGTPISADLNHDGFKDLGIFYKYSSGLDVFYGDGVRMVFQVRADIFPYDAVFADMDHDGTMDIVGYDQIGILVQYGAGYQHRTSFQSYQPSKIAFGDIGSDGDMDIVATDRNFGEPRAWVLTEVEKADESVPACHAGLKLEAVNAVTYDAVVASDADLMGISFRVPSDIAAVVTGCTVVSEGWACDFYQNTELRVISYAATAVPVLASKGQTLVRLTYDVPPATPVPYHIEIANTEAEPCSVAEIGNSAIPTLPLPRPFKGRKIIVDDGAPI